MHISHARARKARRCWPSGGKVRYRTREDAARALARITRNHTGHVPCRYYRCPRCGGTGWHLTSQERR
jgi:hypothetical protein